jgi:lipopolysaccharide/colanic/teichoic acid biosynthesis glycosyltransferase
LGKRIFDVVVSFIGLVLISPILLVIALMIKVYMPGPVLFRQVRAGRYGRAFTIFKFRTMIPNHHGSTVSISGENRITPLGAVLRKYKLDELPELWNVIRGDMSLVGPRPDMPEYAERLKGEDRLILELRPGITGPASIAFASEEELLSTVEEPQRYNDEVIWPEKVRINLQYYKSRSMVGDFLIIMNTIFKIGLK